MSWSNEDIFEFLELYENESCIWNPLDPQHKNKKAMSDAWLRIQESFSQPCTVEQLKKKKESLMTTFRCHMNRKRAFIESDAEEEYHTNWFAYNKMESFLAPIYQCKLTITEKMLETAATSQQFDEEEPCDDFKCQPKRSSRYYSSSVKKKNGQTKTVKKKMDEGYSTIETVTEPSNNKRKVEPDECDLYAELLAKRLKRFDENVRDSIMHQIDNIMYEAKQKYINPASESP